MGWEEDDIGDYFDVIKMHINLKLELLTISYLLLVMKFRMSKKYCIQMVIIVFVNLDIEIEKYISIY